MKVLQRYLAAEIIRSVLFVLVAFLALFAFFDLMGELRSVGKAGYRLEHAFLHVALGLPGYAYDLIPIAALIGTIYTLAQMAARSEFTIMRVSSLSTRGAALMLMKVGILFAALTLFFGEVVSPATAVYAKRIKLDARGLSVSKEFRSGFWTKDLIRENGMQGNVVGSRFLNVGEIRNDGQLRQVNVYEFDQSFRLRAILLAQSGRYGGENRWNLSNVVETRFAGVAGDDPDKVGVTTRRLASRQLISEVTPDILSVVFTDPERMSLTDLAAYSRHLQESNQQNKRYEIVFWKKLFYPFAVFVMMALALPFAYLHVRSGGVSLKIFTGIMIGVAFQLINSLFGHLGLLNTWPAPLTAMVPGALFLTGALGALWWVQRR